MKGCESPSHEIILVGGGPSLKGYNFEKLRGRYVIAINDASVKIPWATALFSADRVWALKRQEHMKTFAGKKYLAVTDAPMNHIPGVQYLEKVRATGLSLYPDFVHVSGSSGYGALNLAFVLGAKKIILLGFDYKDSSQHWHDSYSWNKTKDNISFPLWASYFDTTVSTLYNHNVTVLNASLDSAISAFPKISLEEV